MDSSTSTIDSLLGNDELADLANMSHSQLTHFYKGLIDKCRSRFKYFFGLIPLKEIFPKSRLNIANNCIKRTISSNVIEGVITKILPKGVGWRTKGICVSSWKGGNRTHKDRNFCFIILLQTGDLLLVNENAIINKSPDKEEVTSFEMEIISVESLVGLVFDGHLERYEFPSFLFDSVKKTFLRKQELLNSFEDLLSNLSAIKKRLVWGAHWSNEELWSDA